MKSLLLFIRLSRPLFLLGSALLYALGVGVANYLGQEIDWNIYFLGQIWVFLLQLSTQYLNEYYNYSADQENVNRTPFSGGSGALGPGKLQQRTAFIAGLTCLAFLASITVLLISFSKLDPAVYFVMAISFVGSFLYSVPPVSLEKSGYGELLTSIIVAFLLPAFAYLLQAGELHRYVAMSTFPLIMLHLAMMIAFELPDYANDIKFDKRTMLVRLGWKNGMNFHWVLIVSAYILLAIEFFLGLPGIIVLHALLSIPVAVVQIWQVMRVERGAKPNWTAITLSALATVGAMAYFMTFAYWTR